MPNKWNLDGVSVDMSDNMTITGDCAVAGDLTADMSGYVIFPSSDPLVAGAWWDNAGTLTKSTGS